MKNLDLSTLLRENPYPGRGILLGRSPNGRYSVIAYFIMGRSENSRNRIFVETPDGIRTQAFDPSKMTDPYKQKAIDLANKSYEFTQFLYRVLGLEDLGATFNGEKATYHRSCHMTRILGEREAPFILLDKVKGLEVLSLPHLENCCGFGGTFSVKSPEISEMMVTEKTNDILSTGAEILISADLGCLMNIGGKLNREGKKIRVMHIAEILNTNVDLERIDAVKNPAFIKA